MPPKRKDTDRSGPSATIDSKTVSSPSTLDAQGIEAALSRYNSQIEQFGSKPGSKLRELDNWRLNTLPALVKSRDPAYLDKEELLKLMDWKLTRGKFRPTLPALIAQNTQHAVKSSTQEAFRALSRLDTSPENKGLPPESQQSFRALLKTLCAAMKGVGPATGSLVLSIYDERVPFMSDEAYMWAMYADEEARTGKRKLKREIKYTEKGYLDFAIRMWEIAELVKYTTAQVERVGWVLGKEWISGGTLKPHAGQQSNPETPSLAVEKVPDVPTPRKSKRQRR